MSKTTPLSLGAVEEAPGLSGAKSRGVYVDMVERNLRIQAVAYRDVAAVLDSPAWRCIKGIVFKDVCMYVYS
jgi:hypothetical protein